jgi:hypothetical protein
VAGDLETWVSALVDPLTGVTASASCIRE